jgi:hypothetical protein
VCVCVCVCVGVCVHACVHVRVVGQVDVGPCTHSIVYPTSECKLVYCLVKDLL